MIVDLEKIFKQYVTAYLVKNKGKIDADKIQDVKTELYISFQDTAFDELDGLTPNTYYDDKTNLLEQILKGHLDSGVKVNDYLIDALKRNLSKDKTLEFINSADDRLVKIGLEIAQFNGAEITDNRLIGLLFDKNSSQDTKELAAIILKGLGCSAVNKLIDKCLTEDNVSGVLCDIIAGTTYKRDDITQLLLSSLNKNLDSVPEFCSYLSRHGDDSALDSLCALAKNVTDKIALKELFMTIEALGGDIDSIKKY